MRFKGCLGLLGTTLAKTPLEPIRASPVLKVGRIHKRKEDEMVNKVILIGNVGKDPDIRSFSNGGRVANFSLATSESWKDKTTGERKSKSEWHNVSVTNENLIKVCENYVKKGSKLYLEGKLVTRKWTDKDGNDRYTTEVNLAPFIGELVLLDAKKENQEQYQQAGQVPDLDDDVPF